MSAVVFRGIEGSNPLGFLTALGALRLSDLVWRDQGIRLQWIRDGGWRPQLSGLPMEDEAAFCRVLHDQAPWAPLDAFIEQNWQETEKRESPSWHTITGAQTQVVVKPANVDVVAPDRR